MPPSAGSWTVERIRLTALSAVLVVGALALTGVARTIVAEARQPLGWALASGAVAVLLAPIVALLSKRVPRGLAIAITVLLLVALVLTVLIGFLRDLRSELDHLKVSLPAAAAALEEDETVGSVARDLQLHDRIEELITDLDARYAERTTLQGAAGTAPAYFVNMILVVFLLVWGPRTYRAFIRQFAVREQRERLDAVLTKAVDVGRRYLLVVLAQAVVIGLLTAGALWLADIPAPAVVAVAVAAMSLVPHAGIVFASMLPLLLSAALRPGGVTLALALFFVALQALSSAVVQRRLHAATLHVGPALVVITALIGYQVYDLGGAFYAVVLGVFAVAVLETARPTDTPEPPCSDAPNSARTLLSGLTSANDERSDTASGHVPIDGCFNVRDAGGWPIEDGRWMRRGVLYRADEPVRLTPRGRAAIDALGLRAVVDLRQTAQFDRGHFFASPEITHHIPTVDRVLDVDNPPPKFEDAVDIADLYEDMVQRGSAQLVRAVDTVAEHIVDGPVLVHCVAGKDRTGLVVALIQAAIGVGPDSVVAEYALSDEPTQRRRTAMLADPLHDDPPIAKSPALLWTAPAEAMAAYVRRLTDRLGSFAAWPIEVGLSAATTALLRERLVADARE